MITKPPTPKQQQLADDDAAIAAFKAKINAEISEKVGEKFLEVMTQVTKEVATKHAPALQALEYKRKKHEEPDHHQNGAYWGTVGHVDMTYIGMRLPQTHGLTHYRREDGLPKGSHRGKNLWAALDVNKALATWRDYNFGVACRKRTRVEAKK